MKGGFLYEIARQYVTEDDLRSVCFVFPSRRSATFFRKYLGECSNKPIFSPRLITIDDLFCELSNLRKADKVELLYNLYEEYRMLYDDVESFDDFIYWGEEILSDFGDIDKYLVNADKLFANIYDLRELDAGYEFLSDTQREAIRDFWNVTLMGGGGGTNQRKFRELWRYMHQLYCNFRKRLSENLLAYEGMIYRDVAEQIGAESKYITERLSAYSKVVFVGQNALSECEKVLFDYVRENHNGDFYWDYCGEFVTDLDNKASLFIRSYIDRYPSMYKLDSVVDSKPQIDVVSVSSSIGEAKYAAELIKDMGENSTVIVLPDENMLLPMLNSIPESIEKVNVTMGYSLKNSSVATFMQSLAALQLERREEDGHFYHKSVEALLVHPFINKVASEQAQSLLQSIISENKIYLGEDFFKGDIFRKIFIVRESVKDIVDWQRGVLDLIAPHISPLEREFAYYYYTAITRVSDVLSKIPQIKTQTYFRLLRSITSSISVPFHGEPLAGLQIMGPLETRIIDFENMIILSSNEGVFPSNTIRNSFIPYNLKRGFGLPTSEMNDSIAAYHFYRSLYRAKRVVMLYDSRTDGLKSGEESRFIKQLRYHYKYPLNESVCTYDLRIPSNEHVSVEKSEKVMDEIRERFEHHLFSASVINNYLSCPMKFYYSNIKGLQEEDQVVESIDSSKFGTIFHGVMYALYKPYTNEILTKDILKTLIADREVLSEFVSARMQEEMSLSAVVGKNLIYKELIVEMVISTVNSDISIAPFEYRGGEIKLTGSRIKGFIDRVDVVNGNLRVVDYKTGGVKCKKMITCDDVDTLFTIGDEKRAYTTFQMLFYTLLMRDVASKYGGNVDISVYEIPKINSKAQSTNTITSTLIDRFEERLNGVISDIFNPEIPFYAAERGRKCDYCPIKNFCTK